MTDARRERKKRLWASTVGAVGFFALLYVVLIGAFSLAGITFPRWVYIGAVLLALGGALMGIPVVRAHFATLTATQKKAWLFLAGMLGTFILSFAVAVGAASLLGEVFPRRVNIAAVLSAATGILLMAPLVRNLFRSGAVNDN